MKAEGIKRVTEIASCEWYLLVQNRGEVIGLPVSPGVMDERWVMWVCWAGAAGAWRCGVQRGAQRAAVALDVGGAKGTAGAYGGHLQLGTLEWPGERMVGELGVEGCCDPEKLRRWKWRRCQQSQVY